MNDPDLYKVLSLSYANKDKQNKEMSKYGYKFDSMLSNNNNQIYYNPETQKLIHSVKGTNPFSPQDLYTDAMLAVGKLKDTSRYQDSHKILRDAKTKYNINKADVIGHSLGGAIASYIGSKGDNILTFNKGATLGQHTRNNERDYRTSGDIVSLANANSRHMQTIKGLANPLNNHSVNAIRNSHIRI